MHKEFEKYLTSQTYFHAECQRCPIESEFDFENDLPHCVSLKLMGEGWNIQNSQILCPTCSSYYCDNCETYYSEEELEKSQSLGFSAIDRIIERLEPGGTVPSGQCPDPNCGALIYHT